MNSRITALVCVGAMTAGGATAPSAVAQFEQNPAPLMQVPNYQVTSASRDYPILSTPATLRAQKLCHKTATLALKDPANQQIFAVQHITLAPRYVVTNDEIIAQPTPAGLATLHQLAECGFISSSTPTDNMEQRIVASDYGSVYVSAFSNRKFVLGVKKLLDSGAYTTPSGQRINFGAARHLYETGELDQQYPSLDKKISDLALKHSGCKVFKVNKEIPLSKNQFQS